MFHVTRFINAGVGKTFRWANYSLTNISDQEWQSFRRRIKSLAESVTEQIQNYPPPIPACDAQFNYLLELRQTLPKELLRLEVVVAEQSMSIEAFVRSSPGKDALSALLRDSD